MRKPSERQLAILRKIGEAEYDRMPCPTARELCNIFGLKSTNAIGEHMASLEKMGLLTRGAGKSRSTRLTEAGRKAVNMPAPPKSYAVDRLILLETLYLAAAAWHGADDQKIDASHKALEEAIEALKDFDADERMRAAS